MESKRENQLTRDNIDRIIGQYLKEVEELAGCVKETQALPLLHALKRGKLAAGPYPKVSLFEAANRIMTDLVVLYGVKWLLVEEVFPFTKYSIEYGHGNTQEFDIHAEGQGKRLYGEAFNVAESFFPTKMAAMRTKLRENGSAADYKILVFNHDAVEQDYAPTPELGYHYVVVHVGQGTGSIFPPIIHC